MPCPLLSLSSIQGIPPAFHNTVLLHLSTVSSLPAAPHARGSRRPASSASTRLGCFSLLSPSAATYLLVVPEPPKLGLTFRPPRRLPSIAPVAEKKKILPIWHSASPKTAPPNLPVTPLPPASYRHRLPQQAANCSATTRRLIG